MGSFRSISSRSSVDPSDISLNPNEYGINSIYRDPQMCCNSTNDSITFSNPNETFDNSICSICQNRRPAIISETKFTHAYLFAATNGFSASNMISSGEYGVVYKGKLVNELTIAVKEQKDASFQGEKKLKSEFEALSKSKHEHVVMLLGSCLEEARRFLVYEYVCHGSLDQHIAAGMII